MKRKEAGRRSSSRKVRPGTIRAEPADAVAAAKKLEVEGRDFYLNAAKGSPSDAVRKMFGALAEDESRHLEWLDRLAPGVSASEANRALWGSLKGVFGSATALAAGEASSDIRAIDFAIGIEERSAKAYSAWAKEGATGELRRLGEVLVGQERFHRQLLENAKEYLDRPGDWFMQEERWNFEGG